jgi:hypothetical protein
VNYRYNTSYQKKMQNIPVATQPLVAARKFICNRPRREGKSPFTFPSLYLMAKNTKSFIPYIPPLPLGVSLSFGMELLGPRCGIEPFSFKVTPSFSAVWGSKFPVTGSLLAF